MRALQNSSSALDGGGAAQAHQRHDGFAPFAVGGADHSDFGHRRVFVQQVLDLARIHVLAARDDHVLLAVDDVEAPGWSQRPISPVRNQPSRNDSCVAFSLRQYPANTCSPRTMISPG